jgi:hypothetical protein
MIQGSRREMIVFQQYFTGITSRILLFPQIGQVLFVKLWRGSLHCPFKALRGKMLDPFSSTRT